MWLNGFKRDGGMGSAFSRGNGDHLPPMQIENSLFVTETQADNLRPELTVELMDEDQGALAESVEEGLVTVEPPQPGKMVRVKVTGQAIVYVSVGGKLIIDNRGY
mgnify:CR=1 FL=1|tara:strand:- start:213 stop:527 length:315 start_codon:yes stop_codon:yes gene_type:complete